MDGFFSASRPASSVMLMLRQVSALPSRSAKGSSARSMEERCDIMLLLRMASLRKPASRSPAALPRYEEAPLRAEG